MRAPNCEAAHVFASGAIASLRQGCDESAYHPWPIEPTRVGTQPSPAGRRRYKHRSALGSAHASWAIELTRIGTPPGSAMRSAVPAARQAAGAPSAWSQTSHSTHERPRRWCDAGSPGRSSVPVTQKAGDEGKFRVGAATTVRRANIDSQDGCRYTTYIGRGVAIGFQPVDVGDRSNCRIQGQKSPQRLTEPPRVTLLSILVQLSLAISISMDSLTPSMLWVPSTVMSFAPSPPP